MKKTMTIMTITVASAAVLLVVCSFTFLWELMYSLYSSTQVQSPIIPYGNTLYVAACLIIASVVCFCSRFSKGVAIEITSIVCLSIVVPFFAWALSTAQMLEVCNTMTPEGVALYSISVSVSSYGRSLMEVASALCLVVCGMSIAEKTALKKDISRA